MKELNTVYAVSVGADVVDYNVKRIQGQIFKLLPAKEEGQEIQKPLETLVIETLGLSSLLPQEPKILAIASKLQGMANMEGMDYMTFRRTIFDCCGLCGDVRKTLCP